MGGEWWMYSQNPAVTDPCHQGWSHCALEAKHIPPPHLSGLSASQVGERACGLPSAQDPVSQDRGQLREVSGYVRQACGPPRSGQAKRRSPGIWHTANSNSSAESCSLGLLVLFGPLIRMILWYLCVHSLSMFSYQL